MRRRLIAGGAALAAVLLSVPLVSAPPATAAGAGSTGDAFSQTRTVTRDTWVRDGGGYDTVTTSRQVTVKVDHTQNLRGRQRVDITWSGAKASGARSASPYGEQGINQEYPVLIMQCRGQGEDVTPQTCWTSTWFQRSQVSVAPGNAVWTRDEDLDPAAVSHTMGVDPYPGKDVCATATSTTSYAALTPFERVDGTLDYACDATHMPPEAAVDSAFPPAEEAAFTDADGNGSVKFEVRSETENQSLGCSEKVACSIVVLPIMGVSCAVPTGLPTAVDNACNRSGQWAEGSSNFASQGVDAAVSPQFWWSPSNWRNRIQVPITFGTPPDTCDVLDPRAPTGFYGSELLAQASLQWAPAYCLDRSRFKFQHNQMPDAAGFQLMADGDAPAAEVSSAHDAVGTPVGYAPTAVTGFGIGYVIDRPDNVGEYTSLRLDPRLLAKLLTQSYTGSSLGSGHPGMEHNVKSINLDPEFVRLNPGLSSVDIEAASTLFSLSTSSDVIEQLTAYIAADKDAMDFIAGKPDPSGMVVNPSYKGIALPTAEWPLLDTYVPPVQSDCLKSSLGPYFQAVAAPVSSMLTISQSMIDAWPLSVTSCSTDLSTMPPLYKMARVGRQSYGNRFMLGVVTLGDAARFGIPVASLRTADGTFARPDRAGLATALGLMRQSTTYGPFALAQSDVARSSTAYPGTMVVYTAAKLAGLDADDAAKVAQFIRISTTEGQRPGSANGQLPEGFLPLARTGATARLFASAQAVAAAIEAQKGLGTTPATATPSPKPPRTKPSAAPATVPTGPTTMPSGPTAPAVTAPGGATPVAGRATSTTPSATSAAPVIPTAATTSGLGRVLLPLLLGLGLLAGLASAVGRLLVHGIRR